MGPKVPKRGSKWGPPGVPTHCSGTVRTLSGTDGPRWSNNVDKVNSDPDHPKWVKMVGFHHVWHEMTRPLRSWIPGSWTI